MPYPPNRHTQKASMASRRIAPMLPSNSRIARKPEKTKMMASERNRNPITSCHRVRAGFKTAGITNPRNFRLWL